MLIFSHENDRTTRSTIIYDYEITIFIATHYKSLTSMGDTIYYRAVSLKSALNACKNEKQHVPIQIPYPLPNGNLLMLD